jgi:hypothetical protein
MAERSVTYLEFNLINTVTVVLMVLAGVAILSGISLLYNAATGQTASNQAGAGAVALATAGG